MRLDVKQKSTQEWKWLIHLGIHEFTLIKWEGGRVPQGSVSTMEKLKWVIPRNLVLRPQNVIPEAHPGIG